MRYVSCPYCRHNLADDGSLAGQLVACPTCRGQFTMPSVTAPPAMPVPASTPFMLKSGNTPAHHSARKSSSLGLWIAGGALTILMLPCVACGLLGIMAGQRERSTPQRQKTTRPIESAYSDDEIDQILKRPNENATPPPKVTYSNFSLISTGMSKTAVCDILGHDYEVLSENEIGQGTQFHVKTEMLSWKAGSFSFGSCNVIFQNDKVFQKSQFGLK